MDRRTAAMRFSVAGLPIVALALCAGLSWADDGKKLVQARPKATLAAGTKLDVRALAHHIDEAIVARMRSENVSASPRCDDAEFLRRVCLDITGRIPSVEKAKTFLDSREPNKRAALIDDLLSSEDYGKHQADIWQSLLLPRTSDNRAIRFDKMTKWLEDNFNKNKPWDGMVREILTADGEMDKNSAVIYFLANASPDKLTDNATRMFLGVQLQCAQCHNHPFTEWKQSEYWGMAAFFTKVRVQGNPRAALMRQGTLAINEGGKGRLVRLPVSAKKVPPKFLQGEEPKLTGDAYRPVLADWMTSPKNAYFSKAMVNRVWSQFFGRGIVNPVDDMHEGHAPSHPQLLADLADQFAANGFDVKHLIRAICNSQTYQRTSKPSGGNREAGPELFSRMAVKVFTPEQMFDSLTMVLGAPNPANRPQRQGVMAARFRNFTPRSLFVLFFKGDENADPTEYQAGIPQVLRLMNSPQLNNGGMLAPLLKAGKTPAQIVEHLYLAALSRRPNPRELNRTLTLVGKYRNEPRLAYADILWALLNSSEFTLNH